MDYKPLPPEVRADLRQDRIHKDVGRGRAVSIKNDINETTIVSQHKRIEYLEDRVEELQGTVDYLNKTRREERQERMFLINRVKSLESDVKKRDMYLKLAAGELRLQEPSPTDEVAHVMRANRYLRKQNEELLTRLARWESR